VGKKESEVEVKKETVGCGKGMGCISIYPFVFSVKYFSGAF
jgi:hypothetical protein